MAAGGVFLAAGYFWALQFPIIKAIWTSSFVLVTAGYSTVLLATAHQVIDVWRWQGPTNIFIWIGTNAITLYMLNEVMGFEPFATRFAGGDFARLLDRAVTPGTGSLVLHLLGLVFAVGLAGFLYRRRIFVHV
jgi:predicted acyltransferase